MAGYLLVNTASDAPAAKALSDRLEAAARAEGLDVRRLNSRTWTAFSASNPPPIRIIGPWVILGDVIDRRQPDTGSAMSPPHWDYEAKLMARIWGRYVGVRFGAGDRLDALLRDPSGALDCVAWPQDGLILVASDMPIWLFRQAPPDWRINRERLANGLRDPVSSAGPLMLDGPVAVLAGTVQPLPLDAPAVAVWEPADIARRSFRPPSLDVATERLRCAIDEAVAGLADLPGALAAEVSGGLDSSLIAASLTEQSPNRVQLWINAVGSTPEADERAYVAALAARLGLSPTSVPHATARMTTASLERVSGGFHPGLNAMDQAHDRDWAERFASASIDAVITGKGGDSILVQAANPDVFADRWRDRGPASLRYPESLELARANEVSLWTLVRHARRAQSTPPLIPLRRHPILPDSWTPGVAHPWARNLSPFGPAKVHQILGVADSVSRHAPSRLTETVDVRHPLCAQPVIEACLALPTWMLAASGRDRGLARRAFSDRLPAAILDRRSKGDMTRIYGRQILENLDFLRDWLMGGRLADLGLIDAEAVDQTLTPALLMARGQYSLWLTVAAYEGWVRVWEQRLGLTP